MVKGYITSFQDFDWLRYLNGIFANVSKNVTAEDNIVVYAPDFLRNMVTLVLNTPKRYCYNYKCYANRMNGN